VRVLFVDSETRPGGAGAALLSVLAALDRERVTPLYASLGFGDGDLPEQVAQLGIRVFRLPAGRFRDLRRTLARVAKLRRIVREERVDVVLSNSGHPLLFARPAAALAHRPCVWWVHGWEPTDPLRGHFIALAEQMLSADLLLCNSEHTARAVRTFSNGAPVAVVRPGIDLALHRPAPEEGAAARAALGIGPGERVAGIFGRLQRWKGQHVFLSAAAALARRGLAGRWLVVGDTSYGIEPEYAAALRRQARDVGLEGAALFLGQRDDINGLMNACDVVVHASIEPEPLGLVVQEAMAAGRAVIASAAGGPLELIEHARTGWLVPPDNPAALASALERLLEDGELRASLGAAAGSFAAENFDCRAAAACMACELAGVSARFAGRTLP
jgi:glycosyltransferase involved in cell wall biosynthesis